MSTLRLENAGFTYQKGMPDEKTAVSGVSQHLRKETS